MKTLIKCCRVSEIKTLQGYLNLIKDGIFGVLTELTEALIAEATNKNWIIA